MRIYLGNDMLFLYLITSALVCLAEFDSILHSKLLRLCITVLYILYSVMLTQVGESFHKPAVKVFSAYKTEQLELLSNVTDMNRLSILGWFDFRDT